MDTELTSNGTLISITLTLFMLSLITEKISNFIKLYFPNVFGRKGVDEESEKRRERKIQLLSGVTGITVALLCNADFFYMIRSEGAMIPWMDYENVTFRGIMGCVISGLFLSQGSKFFHDLLDVLLYYKNVKKTLYNKQEIENSILSSGAAMNADEFIAAVKAEDRNDDPDNNL